MNLDTWTATKIMTTATRGTPAQVVSFHDVAFGTVAGKKAFVAVGPQVLATSLDGGATWDAIKTTLENYSAAASGNGVFVAVGGHTTSWNGVDWTVAKSQQVGGTTFTLHAVAFGGRRQSGVFVAVGFNGTIKTTSDGVSWTTVTSGTNVTLQAIAYGKRKFVAVAGSSIHTSPDGVTWTKQVTPAIGTNPIQTLTFGDGRFMCIDNSLRVLTSPDGVSWTHIGNMQPGTFAVNGIVFAFDTWVAADAGGRTYTSPDGVTWTKRYTPLVPSQLGGVAYGTNRCVAVAADGQVAWSEEYPNAELLALTCSSGQVTPTFTSQRLAYDAELTQDSASVTPTGRDGATINVRFDEGAEGVVLSGTASAVSQVGHRAHKFSVTVKARNGFKRVYVLGVSQKPGVLPVPGRFTPSPWR